MLCILLVRRKRSEKSSKESEMWMEKHLSML